MVTSSSSFAKALFPGVSSWYGKAYNEHEVEYTDLFDVKTSKRAYEEHVGVSGFGQAAQKLEGASIPYDDESQAFLTRFQHVVYGLGFIITKEMVDDDLYDVVGERRASGLAFSMRQTKETVAANVYNRAFDGSYLGGDGLEMCSAAHVNYAGGTWANELSTSSDISEAALEQACIDMEKWTNDRGLKIAVKPRCIVIPVDIEFDTHRILNATFRVATADNDPNAIRQMGKFPDGVKVNHYLTDTDAWFLRSNLPTNGMCFYQRRPMNFTVDNDFDTENAKYKATERYSAGWIDPRAIFGSPGA